MRTLHGHFWPLDPREDEVDIRDIAHGLATTNRYGGQFPAPFSVAQHSCMVSELCQPANALVALLHDAEEAYTGDLIKPLKAIPELKAIWEDRKSVV